MIALLASTLAFAGPSSSALSVFQEGYLDVGWFVTTGDGVAYQRDAGHQVLGGGPDDRYLDAPWVFYGDPWANAVNSQGDAADLGLDRTNIDRYDPIASGGRPTFLVNRYHHRLGIDRGQQLGIRVGVNLEPRSGFLGRPGDVIAVDTAYVVWRPLKQSDFKLYAGRMESAFGREYRDRHAPDRVGITPSIMSRYLMGLQTGIRARGTFRRWLGYSVALTNGGTTTERFGHVSNDLDFNGVPTATVRLGATLRRPVRLEVGASGQVGSQDAQRDPRVIGWQVGVDGRLDAGPVAVQVEGTIVRLPGSDQDKRVESLRAHGGYVHVQVRPRVELALLGRVDWRQAELWAWPNLYVSDVMRLTGGIQFEPHRNIALKAEYLHLQELHAGTGIDDDVFTTSMVFHFATKPRTL